MRTVSLGTSGLSVFPLIFGTLPLGPLQANLSPQEGGRLIRYALERGVTMLDSAELYGTYPHLRAALEGYSGEVVLTTKTMAADGATARAHVEKALRELGRERIEIQFTALNLAAPDRARFRYRLHGHETAWTDAGNTRVARYSKLWPGDYRFQVTASNEDGVWNDTGSTLAITVQPPFWMKWWFLTGVAVALVGAIVAAVSYISTQRLQRQVETLRQQEALERERARIARDLHDQLGASLTQVSLLGELVESDKESPPDVEAHAQQISRTARDTTRVLDEIVWAVNPSNDTLDSQSMPIWMLDAASLRPGISRSRPRGAPEPTNTAS